MPLLDLDKLTAGLGQIWSIYPHDWDRSLRSANYPETTRYNCLLAADRVRAGRVQPPVRRDRQRVGPRLRWGRGGRLRVVDRRGRSAGPVADPGLTVPWGLRLAVHIHRRDRGRDEDRRYVYMAERAGEHVRRYMLTRVYLVQAALLWFVSQPVQSAQVGSGWGKEGGTGKPLLEKDTRQPARPTSATSRGPAVSFRGHPSGSTRKNQSSTGPIRSALGRETPT